MDRLVAAIDVGGTSIKAALVAEVRDVFVTGGHFLCDIPFIDTYIARETARRGYRDQAIETMRTAVGHLVSGGQLLCWGVLATGVFVETLLDRGTEADMAEAEAATETLAAPQPEGDLTMREVWLQRMRALLAQARGDVASYAQFRDRYRDMARTLGLEGHIDWAEAMP